MTLPNPIEEGVFYDVEDASYRSAEGVSQTALKEMFRSPRHYKLALENPKPPTKAMIWGRIAHQLLLEPSRPRYWVVKPKGMKLSTTEGIVFKKANKGREILDQDEMDNIEGALASVREHPIAQQAFQDGLREVSVFKRFNFGGSVMRKGRMDICSAGRALADFKFVEDATEEEFSKQVFSFRYYVQAAYYLDLWNDARPDDQRDKFVFFAVEKEPPFPVITYELDASAIGRGRAEYTNALATVIECQQTGNWPLYHQRGSYGMGVKLLKLPKWSRKTEQTLF